MTDVIATPDLEFDETLVRIANALAAEEATADEIRALHSEAVTLAAKAHTWAVSVRKKSLDPKLPRAEVEKARHEADAADNDLRRLHTATEALEERLDSAMSTESEAARRNRYDAVRGLTAELVSLIRAKYPSMVEEYVSLCQKIMACNEAVDQVNRELPEDCAPLDRPEGIARGFPDRDSYEIPASIGAFRIVEALLPSLEPGTVAWPPNTVYELQVLQQRRGFRFQDVRSKYRK